MKFREITLPVHDPSRWTSWLTDVPELPALSGSGVRLGWTTLRFSPAPEPPPGTTLGHHLAFAVPTGTVEDAARRIVDATGQPLLDDDGTTVIDRGGNWTSRSIYFTGPENSVLELIEHADRPADTDTDQATGLLQLLGVAEIGLGVPDVAASGDNLQAHDGDRLPYGFGDPARRVIAAYGDIDGAIVLARDDRPWYPTQDTFPVTHPATYSF